MTKEKTDYKKMLNENKRDAEMLARIVSEVNSWNGTLEDYEIHDFDEDFFSTYFEGRPEEAARATFFGNIQNWMDAYIRFDGYGNLESLSSYQRDKELEEGADEIVAEAINQIDHIDLVYITEELDN